MALPVVIPNAVQIRLLSDINGEAAVNVMGATVIGQITIDQTLADNLGGLIKGAWSAQVGALMGPNTQLVHVGVRDLRSASQPEFLDSGVPAVGTNPGNNLPASVALCVTLRTGKAGKRFRGRLYLGGWADSENSPDGATDATADGAAVSFVNALAVGLPANGLGLAVLSRPSEASLTTKVTTHLDGTTDSKVVGRTTASPGFATPMTSAESRTNRWESQRRRDNGRGTATAASTFVARAVFPKP
jgi:hypothetical protein